jgi:CDGSH-type Zn-finger protein
MIKKLKLIKDGPILVHGVKTITLDDGTRVDRDTDAPAALCRCGHSSIKPFCDGTHAKTKGHTPMPELDIE